MLACLNAEVRSLALAASHMSRTSRIQRVQCGLHFGCCVPWVCGTTNPHLHRCYLSVSSMGRAISSVVLAAYNCTFPQYGARVFIRILQACRFHLQGRHELSLVFTALHWSQFYNVYIRGMERSPWKSSETGRGDETCKPSFTAHIV